MDSRSEALRIQLTDMVKADVDVFNKVMGAYGLPKESSTVVALNSPLAVAMGPPVPEIGMLRGEVWRMLLEARS